MCCFVNTSIQFLVIFAFCLFFSYLCKKYQYPFLYLNYASTVAKCFTKIFLHGHLWLSNIKNEDTNAGINYSQDGENSYINIEYISQSQGQEEASQISIDFKKKNTLEFKSWIRQIDMRTYMRHDFRALQFSDLLQRYASFLSVIKDKSCCQLVPEYRVKCLES